MFYSAELQRAVYVRLDTFLPVPVHNAMPQAVKAPYVIPGDETLQIPGEFYVHGSDGATETFWIHVWDDYHGTLRLKRVMASVYALLNAVTLNLDGGATAKIQPHPNLFAQVIRDQPDDRAKYWYHGFSPWICWLQSPTSSADLPECCSEST